MKLEWKNRLSVIGGCLLVACQATSVETAVPVVSNTAVTGTPFQPARQAQSFADWIIAFKAQAATRGISAATLEQAFAGVSLNQRVLELDSRQPEFTRPIWQYLTSAISERRVSQGRQLLMEYSQSLNDAGRRYGVEPPFIVAIWGIESDYGRAYGDFNVIEVLATLAYEGRRRQFGQEQLLAALQILERGDIPAAQMEGSWAGAMGHTQFIPTSFLQYAVDADGDGRRDLWNSLPDVFASTANYLAKAGWSANQPWGFEVVLPEGFDWDLSDPTVRKPLAEWALYGIHRADGSDLPDSPLLAEVLAPAGHRGPAFLVLDNFRTILRYNNATSYALAVAHLADRITGKGPIRASWPTELEPLSRTETIEMQRLLQARGFDPGAPDGLVGPRTRAAVKQFQRSIGEPNDGFPTQALLARLRGVAS